MFQTVDLSGSCAVCGAPEGTECSPSCCNDLIPDEMVKPVKHTRKCLKCRRELSKYLDAYYGRNIFSGAFCRDCRIEEKP